MSILIIVVLKRVEIDVQSGTFKRDSGIEVRSNNIKDENLNAIRAAEAYKKTSTNESHRGKYIIKNK